MEKMLFEAVFWNLTVARPDMIEFFKETKFNRFLSGWGRPGDASLIAETEDMPVGAAWYRLFKKDEESYGFVNENTPEIGMAVTREYRSQGLGRKLLKALTLKARSQGFKSLSLSVDPHNFALKLYESEGFRKVGESGTSWTLLLQLK
jgi:ribosomal protein S18 acetylase RimI-like enzyme